MNSSCFRALLLGALLVLSACATDPTFIHSEMDLKADPGQDFYRYTNGGWLDQNPVPPEESAWGSGHEVRERNRQILKQILEEAADDPGEPGTTSQQIGDYYASGMDADAIEAAGIDPLRPELEQIEAVSSVEELHDLLARLHPSGVDVVFSGAVMPDFEDSETNLLYLFQGGLGLPDRDYYTRTDEESATLRTQYLAHVTRMLELLGHPHPQAEAGAVAILEIEKALAEASFTNVQMRDIDLITNKVSIAEADALMPGFSLPAYFEAIGAPAMQNLNATNPEFFTTADRLMSERPLEEWKDYCRWHLAHAYATSLSPDFVDESFGFFGTTLSGRKEQQERWKRVLDAATEDMGENVGRLYVDAAFSPEAKLRAEDMVQNLILAMGESIRALDWMSDETKQQALVKLEAFRYKIGYPDEWRDYSKLEIDRDSFARNRMRAAKFEFERTLAKLGKPVDKEEWGMAPHEVNAYYNPLLNEIVFPAGILQPPYFDAEADDAVNYGAMGAVIGHEITHGFDDQGSRFDAEGNVRMWWTPEDREEFERRSEVVVQQFNDYVAVDDLHVNGELTLGENIADLGGLTIAYAALQKALEGQPREEIGGFTPEQRFFLSWARAWRRNSTPEALRLLVNTNPHSPALFRAIGPIGNMPQFAVAFGLKDSAPMVRPEAERAKIW